MEWETELFRGAHFNVIDATCSCKQTLRSILGNLARDHAKYRQIGRLILKRSLNKPLKLLMYVKILYLKASKPEFGEIWRIPTYQELDLVLAINFRIVSSCQLTI